MSPAPKTDEIPASTVVCRIAAETVEQLKDWTEVAAVKLEPVEDGVYDLWLTNDLDLLTDPERSGES